ncbi:MAG: hypothetical protein K9N49_02810 [Candidatus Marinimicrobia bacterium]|nr:hypothetical protein [Candidatus Neomarinimicrobiota bacterium]
MHRNLILGVMGMTILAWMGRGVVSAAGGPADAPRAGARIAINMTRETDPVTGRQVERISPLGANTTLPYYTRELVTADNRGILVASDLSGELLPYIIYPDEGHMVCVATTPLRNTSSPGLGGERVVYVSNAGILGYAPQTGGDFTGVSELPQGFTYTEPGVSLCGRYAAIVYAESPHPRTRNLLGGPSGEYPSSGSERDAFGMRSVLLWVDLDTGRTKGVAGSQAPGGHPLVSPVNPWLMEFCNNGPWRQVQRMQIARFHEAANLCETTPLFVQEFGHDAVGHEFFLADGRVAAIWMRYARQSDPVAQPAESYILIADPETGGHVAYETPGMRFNHLHGRDGRVFVSEGLSAVLRPAAAPLPPRAVSAHGDLLVKYVVAGSRTEPTVLCALYGTARQHAHAVLDRENRWAIFNDARGENVGVYRVPLD